MLPGPLPPHTSTSAPDPVGAPVHTTVWAVRGLGAPAPGSTPLNDGAAYDPGADTWRPQLAAGGA